MEHGHRKSGFFHEIMVILHGYVSHYRRVYPINIPLNHYRIPLNHHKHPLKHPIESPHFHSYGSVNIPLIIPLIAMGKPPCSYGFPMKNGDFPQLCTKSSTEPPLLQLAAERFTDFCERSTTGFIDKWI